MGKKLMKVIAVLTVLGFMATGSSVYAASEGSQGDSASKGPAVQQNGSGKEGPGWGHGRKHGGPEAFFKDLNLTAEQKEKLKAQREAGKESQKAVGEQLKVKMQALHEEISKPGATRESVNGLVGEVNTLKAQMFSQMVDGIFAMKQVLTPEQFAKMQAKHQERMNKKHQGGWGKHPSEPDQPEPEKE